MSETRRSFLKKSVGAAALAGVASVGALPKLAEAAIPAKWDKEADVVVLGLGGAGACAAIEAHDAKAKVLIIEKQPQATHYSNTRMSGGNYHCPDKDVDKEALRQYARAMMSGDNYGGALEGEMTDELATAMANLWVEYAPQNTDFMKSLDPEYGFITSGRAAFTMFPGAEQLGTKYRFISSTYTGRALSDVPTRDLPKNQKMNGEAFYACYMNGISTRKIEVLFETPATRLITNDKGEVIGVEAKSKGKVINCKAKRAVVLATGGYEYNPEMRKAFLEGPGLKGWAFYGSPANTGDGIIMATSIGAALSKVGKAASRMIGAVPIYHNGLKMGIITDSVGRKGTMVIDNLGRRFANENLITDDPSRYLFYKEAVHMNIADLTYPRLPSWLIFDETMRKSITITSLAMSTAGYGFVPWDKDNQGAIDKGWILKANTLDELATKIQKHEDNGGKMNVADMKSAIENFNKYATAGNDKDFGRKPDTMAAIAQAPFYAMPLYAGGPNTKGGVAVNGKRQVINWLNQPIGRLYSAGEISSVMKFVYQGGGNVAECIAIGRPTGKFAAAEKPWS